MVRSLVSANQDAGTYNVIWNGLNETGEQSASGIYLVMMEANGNIYQQSITLLK
jgi:flagellar hook assembly protein FlgD